MFRIKGIPIKFRPAYTKMSPVYGIGAEMHRLKFGVFLSDRTDGKIL